MKQLNCVISYFFQFLMLYTYIRKLDVTSTIENFLGTKYDPISYQLQGQRNPGPHYAPC